MSGLATLLGASPAQVQVLAGHAALLVKTGRLDAARDAYKVLTDLDPLCEVHWKQWAQLERRAGNIERAEALQEVSQWFA